MMMMNALIIVGPEDNLSTRLNPVDWLSASCLPTTRPQADTLFESKPTPTLL